MLLLIDGYNLLHHSDLLGRGRGVRWLEQARRRLIRQLARHLGAVLAAQTCVVFDAQSPPPDLPDRYLVESIRLFYAVGYPEADDLIEELIARHPAPRRLTVVSSDHRIQRAAARRGATAYDADTWYDELVERGPRLGIRWPTADDDADADDAPGAEKPAEPTTAAELAEWYEHFSLEPPSPKAPPVPEAKPPPPAAPRRRQSAPTRQPAEPRRPRILPRDPNRPLDPHRDNPFPDGYGEDLQ